MVCADLTDEREHEVVFAGEVVVDGAFGKTGGGGNLVDVGTDVSFLGELFGGRGEEFLACVQANFFSSFGWGTWHAHLSQCGWAVTHIIVEEKGLVNHF